MRVWISNNRRRESRLKDVWLSWDSSCRREEPGRANPRKRSICWGERGNVDRCVGKIKIVKCTRERNIERANELVLMMQLLQT